MTPDQYCQQKALPAGSSLYYSLLYLPVEQRKAVAALYAFHRETREVITECSDPEIAHTKLSWWRSEVERCFNGQPQHPVSKALQHPLQAWNLPQEYFDEILDGVQMDLEQHHYETFSEVALYCYRTAGIISLLTAEIYGYRNRNTLKYAQTLGTALQLTRILRNTRRDAQQGRLYIPYETLQQLGIEPEVLLLNTGSEKLRALFTQLTDQASDYFQKAFQELPEEDRYAQHPGIIQAEIHQVLLNEIKTDGHRILEQHLRLTPLRKFWIAWKTNRREKRNHAA